MVSTEALDKLLGTVAFVESRLSNVGNQLNSRLSRLQEERERVETAVARADVRTEKSFLQYYTLMQQFQQMNSGASTSLFG